MPTTLVIVESPAKCKKIESFLGPGYKCVASFGHVRQLTSLKNIDIKNQFQPTFDLIDDKRKQEHVSFLKKEITLAEEVILATDDDREGEAIAWHICDLFRLPIRTTKRIVFHEITEPAVQKAMLHPRTLDMRKVYSQHARQVLDVLVGFTISPLLWKYVSAASENSLSAGRCQTPALKLIYDNQKRIDSASKLEQIYHTTGYFSFHQHCIPFQLSKSFDNDTEMIEFLEQSANHDHVFSKTPVERKLKQSPRPLTTSRIQQLASNEMHISPKETMKLCQTLYEQGYITYMRTDATTYSQEFLDSVKNHIVRHYYNESYLHPQWSSLSNANQQEAHEAIRPTKIHLQTLPDELSPKERKMYKLIWETTLESCMAPAEYLTFTCKLTTPLEAVFFSATHEYPDFLGWEHVKQKKKAEPSKEYVYLQQCKPLTTIPYHKMEAKPSLKDQIQHYSEARLVHLLEECGIGRPSTFSSLVEKIQERGYVKKQDIAGKNVECKQFELDEDTLTETKITKEFGSEKQKLVIQPIGIVVLQFLETHFDSLFQYDYTKQMEDDLDKIYQGESDWYTICQSCYSLMETQVANMITHEKKYEIRLDDHHVYMIGKYGPVIKKTTDDKKVSFLPVKEGIDLKRVERGEYTLDDIISQKTVTEIELGTYKDCRLFLKKGKYGLYASWGEHSKSLSSLGNRPLENIALEEVISILDEETPAASSSIIRFISKEISIRKGKYGDYIFYKSAKMKKPLFLKLDGFQEDYKTCTITCFMNWFSKNHIST